ncbi:hypothetical protein ACIGHN_13245 [Acidovorax sp. NPDC077693]|jgi:hypothetical protein|uniref:hypothetical protein n=1 Tax=unclassified Acidovorax TaxID=2684926 RepID=UPI0037C97511
MQASVNSLDALLQNSDADSMEWADGGGAEDAAEMMAILSEQDWLKLKSISLNRDRNWRACLASSLNPRQGEQAEHLLLTLASDQDLEVAFLAVRGIAFYCGINDSMNGPFIDPKIRVSSTHALAKATSGLASRVRKVGSSCGPRFQRQFELLAAELERASGLRPTSASHVKR